MMKMYDVVHLDFSKAFDKVPHQRLFDEVMAHGIGGNVYVWIGRGLAAGN